MTFVLSSSIDALDLNLDAVTEVDAFE